MRHLKCVHFYVKQIDMKPTTLYYDVLLHKLEKR